MPVTLVRRTASSTSSGALALVVVAGALALAACGGPPKARSGADERLPADGTAGSATAESLDAQTIKNEDWARFATERLKPACDARQGAFAADAAKLAEAGHIIETWTEFRKTDGESKDHVGGAEPTRTVKTIGMTCSADKSSIEVNGVQYPFDIAWVVAGQGTGPSASNNEGVGHFAMLQGLSFKEKKLVLAKVYVPDDSHDHTDDTIVVANVAAFLPESPAEPIVHATGERGNPLLETFVFAKDATSGFAYQVPKQKALGRSRFLAVGKFEVSGP